MQAYDRRKNCIRPAALLAVILAIIVCAPALAAPSASPTEPTSDGSASPSEWNLGFYVHLNELEHVTIEKRIADFQSTNRISDVTMLAFIVGGRKNSNTIELELLIAMNRLYHFMDNRHYFGADESQVLLWYRREISFQLAKMRASALPGAGVGYTSAVALIGRDVATETALLKASALTFGIGARLELAIFSWGSYRPKRHSLDLGMDYSYRFNDMKAKTVNGGNIFFPRPVEFAVTGHYIALGLQYRFAKR